MLWNKEEEGLKKILKKSIRKSIKNIEKNPNDENLRNSYSVILFLPVTCYYSDFTCKMVLRKVEHNKF